MIWKKEEEFSSSKEEVSLALCSLPICVSLLPLPQWTCRTSLRNQYHRGKASRASYYPSTSSLKSSEQTPMFWSSRHFLETQTKIQKPWICNGVISLPHRPTASYSALGLWSQGLRQNLLASRGIKVCYSQWKETHPSVFCCPATHCQCNVTCSWNKINSSF